MTRTFTRIIVEGEILPWPTEPQKQQTILSKPVALRTPDGTVMMLAETDRVVAVETWTGDGEPPRMVTVYADDLRHILDEWEAGLLPGGEAYQRLEAAVSDA